jgi:tetratricopeptide (TPR) repeat protein
MHAPTISNPSFSAALEAFGKGRFDEVERMARTLLAESPQAENVENLLGLALLNRHRYEEAAALFERLARTHPETGLYWNNWGTALRAAGRLDEAGKAYTRALQIEPKNPDFLASAGFLFAEQKQIVRARELLLEALRIRPGDAEVRVHVARMSLECGEESSARELLRIWRLWVAGINPPLQVELATLLIRLGANAEGESLLRAHLTDPQFGDMARARLVLLLERFNRMDEARELLAQLPPPSNLDDEELRGEIMEATAVVEARSADPGRARALLEELLRSPGAERWQVTTWFLLAKLCDKQGDYDACMEYLRLAHQEQLKVTAQLVPDLVEPSSNPLNTANFHVSADQFKSWRPVDVPPLEQSPIFVLGFPRSGTTMLEQMLDAHPGMASMDERPFVQRVIERMQSLGMEYPDRLGELDSAQCEMLRETYWKAVAEVAELKPGQRLVDKNPLTMLRLPLLVRLFPNAKIIFVVRHPCDVVLSNYMQHFNAPAYVALCSTLPRLAAGYAAAMRFWHAHVDLLKPQVFEWNYEGAIRDFDGNVRRLGAFLELEDVAPLHQFSEHAKRKGYIGTPSYAQVVQPVYSGSIGRWTRYRKYFQPVLPILEPAMRHWGYDV